MELGNRAPNATARHPQPLKSLPLGEDQPPIVIAGVRPPNQPEHWHRFGQER